MVAENLLSNTLVPLRTSDTGREALTIMNLFSVRHLPVVEGDELKCVISEDDILVHDVDNPISTFCDPFQRPYVHEYDHIYEVMRLMAERRLTVIPVLDAENHYLGLISQDDLLKYFANTGAFVEPGCIVVLEIAKRDYSLAEISRIVESENISILSSFITSNPQSEKLDVTLKLNTQNIQNILATFERFNFMVKASFNETDYLDTLRERYDALMTYLNV